MRQGIEYAMSGSISPGPFDSEQLDPVTASIFKKTADKQNAFLFAWEIYPFFEFLVGEYLTKDHYEKYLSKFGSPLERAFRE